MYFHRRCRSGRLNTGKWGVLCRREVMRLFKRYHPQDLIPYSLYSKTRVAVSHILPSFTIHDRATKTKIYIRAFSEQIQSTSFGAQLDWALRITAGISALPDKSSVFASRSSERGKRVRTVGTTTLDVKICPTRLPGICSDLTPTPLGFFVESQH